MDLLHAGGRGGKVEAEVTLLLLPPCACTERMHLNWRLNGDPATTVLIRLGVI